MSSRSYQPTAQMSYQTLPVSLPTRPPPPKRVASYRQPSNSNQGGLQIPPATYVPKGSRPYKSEPQANRKSEQTLPRGRTAPASTTFYKSRITYADVPETARPVRQCLDITPAEAFAAQIRREKASSSKELSDMVPGNAGQVQRPALERRDHQSGSRSYIKESSCCPFS